ncbi:endochitinase-like [Cornus florida]|uniref:endochitinase-like n=1 Tax=Cornus florida TaxID=4283 RepID=UPI002898B916|nr:endochitinase-like [Cornus florida]
MRFWTPILFAFASLLAISAEQCGSQAGGALCPNGLCCSKHGYCGTTDDYCGDGCQSQCTGGPTPSPPPPTPPTPCGGDDDISCIITPSLFDEMLAYRNDARCPSNGFYQYDAFITAAKSFDGFGTTGDADTRKRELVAFLGQTSHETTGGWDDAPGGRYAWGYCYIEEREKPHIPCDASWPCNPDKEYYGRGPIQLTHNYNYAQAGEAIGEDLINNPELVANNSIISFRTAIWFWMTPQYNKPSSHSVITGIWIPSNADIAANRVPGYGVITNIINGGLECGHGPDDRVENRIGFYKRYCDIVGLSYGDNLDCNNQTPFSLGYGIDYKSISNI